MGDFNDNNMFIYRWTEGDEPFLDATYHIDINPPELKTVSYNEDILSLIQQLDEEMYLGYLENLTAFGPRVTGTTECDDAGDYIYNQFVSMGLDSEYYYWEHDSLSANNIIGTYYGVDPSSILDPSLIRGDAFNVSIGITMALEVYAWSFNMSWDPTLLNVTEIKEGSFLNHEGAYNTSFATKIRQEEGYLYANCTLLGEAPEASASGNGTLIIVTFMVETKGATVLHISEATLMNYEGVEISALTKDGYFSNTLGGDVAIISVSVSPSRVRAGDSVVISLVAKNEGEITFGQSVDVTIYYNERFLGTLGVFDMNPGDEKTLSFSWTTKDLDEGNYTIEAVASPLPGETNTTNNSYAYKYLVVMPSKQSFPFVLIIAILVVTILIVLAGVVFLLKKRG